MATTCIAALPCVDTHEAQLSPHFLVRVTGLPARAALELEFVKTSNWAQDVIGLEDKIDRSYNDVVAVLHEAIHENCADHELQRDLIGIKRDVFNRRVPKNLEAAKRLVAQLPGHAGQLLSAWLELTQTHSEIVRRGSALLAAETAEKRVVLKQLAESHDFRKALLLANPGFERKLQEYLTCANSELNRSLRQAERTALSYILRMATKTSPFSTFTPVAYGRSTDVQGDEYYPEEASTLARLNIGLLTRCASLLLSSPELSLRLPVQLKRNWKIDGDRITFSRRIATPVDNRGPLTCSVQETSFHLPFTGTLQHVISILSERRELCLGDLLDELEARCFLNRTELREFLQILLRVDLLHVPGLRPLLNGGESAREFGTGLRQLEHAKAVAIADVVQYASDVVERYPALTLSERRQAIAAIRQRFSALFGEAETAAMKVPETIVYEDAILARPPVRLPAEVRQTLVENLGLLDRLLPVLDNSLGSRLAMTTVFKQLFGEGGVCYNLNDFAERFYTDYQMPYWRARAGAVTDFRFGGTQHASPEQLSLQELRKELTLHLQDSLDRSAGARELVVSREFVSSLNRRIPERSLGIQSHSYYLQMALEDGEDIAVLNNVYGGLGQMFSRFAHLFDESSPSLDESLRNTLKSLEPAGAAFGEIQGGHDTNLNLHPPLARYDLLFPGERSARPASECLMVDDLYLKHDVEQDRLRLFCRHSEIEIVPVYLGLLVPILLPRLQQVLANLSALAVAPVFSLWEGVEPGTRTNGIQFLPRVRLGNVVLERARWIVPVESLPRMSQGQSAAAYFLDLTRWRLDCGLPRLVFVRLPKKERNDDEGGGDERGSRKPFYIDFENCFCGSLLDNMLSQAEGSVTFTEMLPDPSHIWPSHCEHFTEFVIELNRPEVTKA